MPRYEIDMGLEYSNERPAFRVYDEDGMPYAALSINVPEIPLEPGEFILNHDLNHSMFEMFLNEMLTIFEDTGKRCNYGFVKNQPIWRLRK